MFLTKDQVQNLFNQLPPNASREELVTKLLQKGYQLEGLNSSSGSSQTSSPQKPSLSSFQPKSLGKAVPGQAAAKTAQGVSNFLFSDPIESMALQKQGMSKEEADAQSNMLNKAGNVAAGVVDYGVKPIVKGATMATYGALKPAIESVAAGVQGASPQEQEKILDQSIKLPWLGEVNPNANTQNTIGAATDLASTLIPTNRVAGAAARGAVQGFGKELQEEGATVEDAIFRGGLEGTLSAGMSYGFNKLFGAKAPKTEKQIEVFARKNNLDPAKAKIIANLKPDEKPIVQKFLNVAEKAKNSDELLTPMEQVADDFTTGMKKLYNIQKTKGSEIGTIKGNVVTRQAKIDPINIQDQRKLFLSQLAEKGVYVGNNGSLNFKKSSFVDLPGDQKALQNLWKAIKKKDALSGDEAIILRERLQNNLYSGKVNKEISAAEKFLTDFEKSLTNSIHKNTPELGELDSVFSELIKAVKAFQKKTSGTTQLTAEEVIDGTNAYNLLRRSLGAGVKENKAILEKLQKLGQKYDIPELKNIMKVRRLAQIAEDAVGIDMRAGSTTLMSRVSNFAKGAQATVGLQPLQAAENFSNAFKGTPQQVKVIEKLLKEAPETKKSIVKMFLSDPKVIEGLSDTLKYELNKWLTAGQEEFRSNQ